MSILDQHPGQFIARPGIRHLHTVKLFILIMIVNEQRWNIPFPDFLIKTQIRIGKGGPGSLNDEPGHIPV